MKKRFFLYYLLLNITLHFTSCTESGKPVYLNADAPVDERVDDLLSRMSPKEKAMQLVLKNSDGIWTDDDKLDTLKAKALLTDGAGMVSPPELSLPPARMAARINALQKFLMEKTHPGIPAFIYGEGLHGYVGADATSFPNPLALGCTWDTALIRQIYTAVALEMRSRGVNQVLSPVLGLGREPRWGRIEETFGEDPYHVSRIGLAAVLGFQGSSADGKIPANHLAATAKHYAVHSQPEGGTNIAPGNYSERIIRENFLQPFETAVTEGNVACIMASYNEIDGVPSHASTWLLQDVLKSEWHHQGYVVSDLGGVEDLYRLHHIAADSAEAALIALRSGVDLELAKYGGCYLSLENHLKNGTIDERVVNNAVRRVLRVKFLEGLFDDPFVNPEKAEQNARRPEHTALALKAAEESIVLLKNKDHLLPLNPASIKSLAVIGPNAGEIHLGGYSFEPRFGVSVRKGLEDYARNRFKVSFAEGCRIQKGEASFWDDGNPVPNDETDDLRLMSEAVKIASASDVVLMVLGGNESTCREAWSESHLGDRDRLDLPGRQNELFEKILKTGKPVVVLLLGGRPLAVTEVAEQADAVFQGFYAGQETGSAFARILFGDVNPSGKLSVTIPRSAGQLPDYYNKKPGRMRSYLLEDSKPLFPFGFGLSYTEFAYSDLVLSKTSISLNENMRASVSVKNTGKVSGEEIVQLYIRDEVSSVTRPVLELKDFTRITLDPGESREVIFILTPEKLRFYTINMQRIVETGKFNVFTGPDSAHLLETEFTVTK